MFTKQNNPDCNLQFKVKSSYIDYSSTDYVALLYITINIIMIDQMQENHDRVRESDRST